MALGFLVLILKLPKPIRAKLYGLDVYIDILFTISLLKAFGSTYSGTSAAIVAGLVFSIALFVMKKWQGYETLALSPRPHWVNHKRSKRNA